MNVLQTQPECAQLRRLMDALGDSDPTPQTVTSIVEHLTDCEVCSVAEVSLARLLALYRERESPPLPAQLEQRLLDGMCRKVR